MQINVVNQLWDYYSAMCIKVNISFNYTGLERTGSHDSGSIENKGLRWFFFHFELNLCIRRCSKNAATKGEAC